MAPDAPDKVLITGGHETGGLTSFAEALAEGFAELGIAAEVIPPNHTWSRWRELRDPRVLKILSTTALFAAPFARRAICMTHGLPCADVQGWPNVLGFLAGYKLANFRRHPLVAVSEYSAIHLVELFNLRIDAVILNPVKRLYVEPYTANAHPRSYITYVGRLHPSKNVHRLLPGIRTLLDEFPGLRACIIGNGALREALQSRYADERIEFLKSPDDGAVREKLRATRVFVSGNQTEGLGIAYLEALSQGCAVAMPASGGGVEIRPDLIGSQIHLLPISLEHDGVVACLRRALRSPCAPHSLSSYGASAAATAYLQLDMERNQPARRWVSRKVEAFGLAGK